MSIPDRFVVRAGSVLFGEYLQGRIVRGEEILDLPAQVLGLAHNVESVGDKCTMECPGKIVFLFLIEVDGDVPAGDQIKEAGRRNAAHQVMRAEPDQVFQMLLCFIGPVGQLGEMFLDNRERKFFDDLIFKNTGFCFPEHNLIDIRGDDIAGNILMGGHEVVQDYGQ